MIKHRSALKRTEKNVKNEANIWKTRRRSPIEIYCINIFSPILQILLKRKRYSEEGIGIITTIAQTFGYSFYGYAWPFFASHICCLSINQEIFFCIFKNCLYMRSFLFVSTFFPTRPNNVWLFLYIVKCEIENHKKRFVLYFFNLIKHFFIVCEGSFSFKNYMYDIKTNFSVLFFFFQIPSLKQIILQQIEIQSVLEWDILQFQQTHLQIPMQVSMHQPYHRHQIQTVLPKNVPVVVNV